MDDSVCRTCRHQQSCQEIYRRLGDSRGPSVTVKVVTGFLVPLVVFVAALAALESLLSAAVGPRGLVSLLSLLVAIGLTMAYAWVAGRGSRRKHG